MIRINHQISIPDKDIQESFIHASGPGGQNVNKVATAVQLRFDIKANSSLPHVVKLRLLKLAGKAVNSEGVLIIAARNTRSRERNRQEARDRLISMIRHATRAPKIHRKTRIPIRSKVKRLENKKKRGELKSRRHRISISES